ncbi:unnamed protein product [Amoebophrya sp. A120]|nr:unnamed protein product [Amoebophrya sp. A120]|eukprot:GSA120T00011879001.1
MSGNSGIVGQEAFLTEFQYHPGIHPKGTPASMAGARVKLPWNEAVVQECKGWGKVILGHRPHHTRPHLLEKVGRLGKVDNSATASTDGGIGAPLDKRRNSTSEGARTEGGTTSPSAEMLEKIGVVLQPLPPSLEPEDSDVGEGRGGGAQQPPAALTQVVEEKLQGVFTGSSTQHLHKSSSSKTSPLAASANTRPRAASAVRSAPPNGSALKVKAVEDDPDSTTNPFSAPKELNDTLGGLIHARSVFQRRVARTNVGVNSVTSKKVVKIGPGVLYVGDVDFKKRPHGEGTLLIVNQGQRAAAVSADKKTPPAVDVATEDGNNYCPPHGIKGIRVSYQQHVGRFAEGRAHGDGVYLTSAGQVLVGSWTENKRVGVFQCLEATGVAFEEKYNESGKKIARKKIIIARAQEPAAASASLSSASEGNEKEIENATTNGATDLPETTATPSTTTSQAETCSKCGFLFHAAYNHSLACRTHVANFVQDDKSADPNKGIWTCCGAREWADLGCNFGMHRSCSA